MPGFLLSVVSQVQCTHAGQAKPVTLGVFHDLFQPQREANLRFRLDEYVPAGSDVGIISAS